MKDFLGKVKGIRWNEVNGLSQVVAIILFVAVFGIGFKLGTVYEFHSFQNAFTGGFIKPTPAKQVVADVTYTCAGGKILRAVYQKTAVELTLPDGSKVILPQAVSGSGARYANEGETTVFWNKGTSAFLEENGKTTIADCEPKPILQ